MFIPTLKSSQFPFPDTKTKWISGQTVNLSNFRPPHENRVNSRTYTETKSISIPHTEIMSISTTLTKTKSTSMPSLKQVIFGPYTKIRSISTNNTKPKSILSPTLKSSQFQYPHWNQVNFDHPHTNQVNSNAPIKAKPFWDEPVHVWRRSPVGAPPAPRPWSGTDDRTPESCKRSISSGNATNSSLTSHLVVLQPRRYPPVNNPPRTKNILFKTQNCRYKEIAVVLVLAVPPDHPKNRSCPLATCPEHTRTRYPTLEGEHTRRIRYSLEREYLSLELQSRNTLAKNLLRHPAVSEKLNEDITYSSSTWTSITTWPEDRRYS